MQQLDLFGFPIESPAPKKKEKPAKAVTVIAPKAEMADEVKEEEETQYETPALAAIAIQEETTLPEPAIVSQPPEPIAAPQVVQDLPVAETVTASPSVDKAVKAAPVKQAGKRGRKSFKEMDSEADLVEVPDDETLQKKLYYSISEVAGWFKVNTSLLRYWENEFDVLQPRKTRKGDRLFRVEDIKNLQLIYFLLRQRKFSIDGAKNYLKNNRQEADTQIRLVESLTRFRSFLLEMKATLQA